MPDAVGKVAVLRTGKDEEERERDVMAKIAAERGVSVEALEAAVARWAERVLDREVSAPARYAVAPLHLSLVKG